MTSPSELAEIINQSKVLIERSRELRKECLDTTAVTMETNQTIREHIERMKQEIKDIDAAILGFKGGNAVFNK